MITLIFIGLYSILLVLFFSGFSLMRRKPFRQRFCLRKARRHRWMMRLAIIGLYGLLIGVEVANQAVQKVVHQTHHTNGYVLAVHISTALILLVGCIVMWRLGSRLWGENGMGNPNQHFGVKSRHRRYGNVFMIALVINYLTIPHFAVDYLVSHFL